ncbi:hypothetical protein ACC754_39160, partial [Rhizobium johnstonii]
SLKLNPLPAHCGTALVAVASLEDAVALYRLSRRECCDLMSAFEFMPPTAFALAQAASTTIEKSSEETLRILFILSRLMTTWLVCDCGRA